MTSLRECTRYIIKDNSYNPVEDCDSGQVKLSKSNHYESF